MLPTYWLTEHSVISYKKKTSIYRQMGAMGTSFMGKQGQLVQCSSTCM